MGKEEPQEQKGREWRRQTGQMSFCTECGPSGQVVPTGERQELGGNQSWGPRAFPSASVQCLQREGQEYWDIKARQR